LLLRPIEVKIKVSILVAISIELIAVSLKRYILLFAVSIEKLVRGYEGVKKSSRLDPLVKALLIKVSP